ncbi:MAG: 5-formyltetrahydrofolate cyclo-ligase [Spirochaeta sp. LUC14_002_19_P3]|nr:MAG: 5-formyltetrahydrofolate cyclo-ligase [Spirochaeta sp. LUC14_002_19_P3]
MLSDKKIFRKKIAGILKSLDTGRRENAAKLAAGKLFSDGCWHTAEVILAYMSMPSELDTSVLIEKAWREAKAVFVPRVIIKDMKYGKITSFNSSLTMGQFGIREPLPDAETWALGKACKQTLILIPGLAFDEQGRRLGRGGGFYDRFLSRLRSEAQAAGIRPPLCLGFAYEEQIVPEVPTASHDEKVDALVTDARFMLCL